MKDAAGAHDAYGYIRQDDGSRDMFVLAKTCEAFDLKLPPAGVRVRYTIVTDEKSGRPRAEDVEPAGNYSGVIKNHEGGSFGYIEQDTGEKDMFVLGQHCPGTQLPPIGIPVVFDIVADQRTGRPRANNVKVLALVDRNGASR